MLKLLVIRTLICICLLLLMGFTEIPELLQGENLVVLEGATLIDGTGAEPQPNSVIVIDGDRILKIGKVGDFTYPGSAEVLQLKTRFIIPGLIDVHAHIQTPIHTEVMKMLLAYGITTVRIPGGTDIGVQVRDMVARGELLGPSVFTGGDLIDGAGYYEVKNEQEARQEVRRQHAQGVDLIKLYGGLPPELLAVTIDEAHKMGLPVIGHLSETTWTEATERGIDGLLHLGTAGPLSELVTLENRQKLADSHNISLSEFERKFRGWKFLFSMAEEDASQSGQRVHDLVDINGPAVDSLIQALVKNNIMVDPTLVTEESLVFGNEVERVQSHLDVYKTPKSVRDFLWGEDWETGNKYVKGKVGDIFLSFKPMFGFYKALTLRFFEEGVTLGAGSDVGMPWMTPGASFHRELELLVEAGIPTKDVLQIATKNGSHFVYRSDEVGTIEPGKFADMVVLLANPLEDIRNTRAIEKVIKSGKMHDPEVIFEELNGGGCQESILFLGCFP